MSSQKKGSKGRFLYLFDWNAKSRKKLFSGKSDSSGISSEESSQGKENVLHLEVPQFYPREPRMNGDASAGRRTGSFSSASSVNGDDEFGTKVPGVVARLMGLDTLPTATTSSAQLREERPLSDSYYHRHPSDLRYEQQIMEYSYSADRLEGIPWNSMGSRPSKAHGRPIERFQIEMLPPKSAKPISITHHKLLSPIKSPGFIPSNEPAYIMEAAARIIDTAPGSPVINRVSSFGSSTPMRIRDLRERMDATNRSSSFPVSSKKPKQVSSSNETRFSSRARSNNLALFKDSLHAERNHSRQSTIKGKKATSHAFQPKDNSFRKDGATSGNKRSLVRKEHKQDKLKQSISSQPSAPKTGHIRTSVNRSSTALRQNDEKQICVSHKEKSTPNSSAPNQQVQPSRKSAPVDASLGPSKIVNKVYVNSDNESRKAVPAITSKKRRSLTKMDNISRNKELGTRESQSDESTAGRASVSKDETAARPVSSFVEDYKRDTNVISFTFTSPIKRSNETRESNHQSEAGFHDSNEQPDSLSPLVRLKLIGSDTLSLLLDQKLKELTDNVEPNQCHSVKERIDAEPVTSLSGTFSRLNGITPEAELDNFSAKFDPDIIRDDSGSSEPNRKRKDTGSADEHGCSSSSKCLPSGEPEFGSFDPLGLEWSNGSGMSSNDTSGYFQGRDPIQLSQSHEEASCISEEFHDAEDDREFSDTASSMYTDDMAGKHAATLENSTNWEVQYVRHILHYTRLKDLESIDDINVIPSSVFDLLEHLLDSSERNVDDSSKLWRKIFFDCVNECISVRYHRAINGTHKSWRKWSMVVQQEDWLAEDLSREIIGLEEMGHLMVDELVDKDMGTQYGGWKDFEIEALEDGIEIETDIMSSLVDELVVDLFSFS